MVPKLVITSNLNPKSPLSKLVPSSNSNAQISVPISRRASLAIGVLTLFNQTQTRHAAAYEPKNNGLWITDLLPIPTVSAKIANKETGTRSFLKLGVYVADIGAEMCRYRLKQTAFDLLAMRDLIYQGDVLTYVRRYLCQKATLMYYDFDTVINAATEDQKPPLLDLANRLFDSCEMLLAAVLKKDERLVKSNYADTEIILQEVMTNIYKK